MIGTAEVLGAGGFPPLSFFEAKSGTGFQLVKAVWVRHLILNNTRLLAPPWIKRENPASKLLSLDVRDLPVEWQTVHNNSAVSAHGSSGRWELQLLAPSEWWSGTPRPGQENDGKW
ncbi:MAG TPA: hypothetical protein VMW83_17115 [Spirochaetia bacterium]|nr:hypothetical protein [Spirochaetia bacterium]